MFLGDDGARAAVLDAEEAVVAVGLVVGAADGVVVGGADLLAAAEHEAGEAAFHRDDEDVFAVGENGTRREVSGCGRVRRSEKLSMNVIPLVI